MKIWVIGRGYPTNENGGWGSFELEQAKMFARNGHEVCYISLTLSFLSRGDARYLKHFKEDGVEIFAYSHLYFPGKLNIHLEGFENKVWIGLYEKVEHETGLPDLMHVHYPSMIGGAQAAARLHERGVKLFVTEHWSRIVSKNLQPYEIKNLTDYCKQANCFICVSEMLLKAAKELVEIPCPTGIVPNIVPEVFFQEKRDDKPHSFGFICVGRLAPIKQFDKVIDAFLEEFSSQEDVRLVIVGSGKELRKLQEKAHDDIRISFTGRLSSRGVAEKLACSDALVSFSGIETFCVPVIDAWACGIPVIVADSAGIASYVKEWLGMVVHRDNCAELRKAMRTMYDLSSHYDPARISQFAHDSFGESVIYKNLVELYRHY